MKVAIFGLLCESCSCQNVTDILDSGERDLLQWVTEKLKGFNMIEIQNWDRSWSDGLAFAALIANWKPHLLDWKSVGIHEYPHEAHPLGHDCTRTFRAAFDAFAKAGVPTILDSEYMREADRRSIMRQVMLFYRHFGQDLPHPEGFIQWNLHVGGPGYVGHGGAQGQIRRPLDQSRLDDIPTDQKYDRPVDRSVDRPIDQSRTGDQSRIEDKTASSDQHPADKASSAHSKPRPKSIDIEVDANETVESIRRKIAEKEGIPPEKQRLVFGGKEIHDDSELRKNINQDLQDKELASKDPARDSNKDLNSNQQARGQDVASRGQQV